MLKSDKKINGEGKAAGKYAKWVLLILMVCLVIMGVLKSFVPDAFKPIRPDVSLVSLNEEGSVTAPSDGSDFASCIFTVPEKTDNLVLSVESRAKSLKVFLDGEELLSYEDMEREMGINIQLVKIPDDAGGRELKVIWQSSLSNGEEPKMYLGAQSDIYLFYAAESMVPALFGGLYILVGVAIAAMFLFIGKNREHVNRKSFLHLAAFVLVTGIWTLTDCGILQLLTGKTAAITFISFLSFTSMPLLFLLFFNDILTEPRKCITVMGRLQAVNIGFMCFCYLTRILSLYVTLNVTHILLLVTIIAVVAVSVSEYRRRRNQELKKILTGVALMLIFVVAAMLSFYLNFSANRYPIYYSAGLFVFIVSLVVVFNDRLYGEIQENAELEAYKKIAFTDLMTGMKNRSAFYTYVNEQKDIGNGNVFTCIVFDVNGLKEINDTYGHAAGDELITDAAACILKCFSSEGLCYRTGGDEFVVILDDVGEDTIAEKLGDMKAIIKEKNKCRKPEISFAYGYAREELTSASALMDLYEEADRNMYRRKKRMKSS